VFTNPLISVASLISLTSNAIELQCVDIGNEVSLLSQYQPDKMRMFGVEIDGPANVFCDNHGVVKNASIPEWVLMKKHDAINYHAVKKAVVAGIFGESERRTAKQIWQMY
jgi:hypothetical protein